MSEVTGWAPSRREGGPVILLTENSPAAAASSGLTAGPSSVAAGYPREIHEADGVRTCIDGFPRWNVEALQRLAADKGQAAALAQAYRDYDAKLFSRLHGHFAFAIIDECRNRVLLAVDRMGTRPMCYAATADGIAFASSADALRKNPAIDTEINLTSVYGYIYFHVIPSPQTIYRGVAKLEPAQCLEYQDGRLRLDYYWTPSFSVADTDLSPLKEELRAALEKSVRECVDGPTGAFLSGGVDSSSVSGMLARVQDGHADTFSIGFSEEGYDEVGFARIAAKCFGTIQHEYYVTTDDVVEAIPQIAHAYDEPFGNSSAIPTLLCARLARESGVQTLLAGDGGDELFAGNERYAKQHLFDAYFRLPSTLRGLLIEPLFLGTPLKRLPAGRKIARYIEQAKIPMPGRMQTYNLLHRVSPTTVFDRDFLDAADQSHPQSHLRAVYERAPSEDLLHRMLFLDWKITLADNDLRKVNRMCEITGVAVRYPMLDDSIVDLSTRVPPAANLRGKSLRYFYKDAFKDFLPPEIIQKKKHGFGLPFGQWLRKSETLQELIQTSMDALQHRHIIRPEFVETLLEAHRSSHAAYYGSTIWNLTLLEQWFQAHGISP